MRTYEQLMDSTRHIINSINKFAQDSKDYHDEVVDLGGHVVEVFEENQRELIKHQEEYKEFEL